jgi:4-hydroxybenzoate polyprenyltransferase
LLRMLIDFLDFIRLGMSTFSAFIAILGYVLFNHATLSIAFVALSSFCVIAASRAYNSLKDTKEDSINRKRVNPFVSRKEGVWVICILYVLGFYLSTFLGNVSVVSYVLIMTAGICYTFFRLNARSFSHLFKNFNGAINIPVLFIFGAGKLDVLVLMYYFSLTIFIFGGSVIADLRDYAGDKKVGKRTLPTVFGYSEAKIIAVASFLIFVFLVFSLFLTAFLIFTVVSFPVILLMLINKPRAAHVSACLSIVFAAGMLFVMG